MIEQINDRCVQSLLEKFESGETFVPIAFQWRVVGITYHRDIGHYIQHAEIHLETVGDYETSEKTDVVSLDGSATFRVRFIPRNETMGE